MIKTLVCTACGKTYEGHHSSKRCGPCRDAGSGDKPMSGPLEAAACVTSTVHLATDVSEAVECLAALPEPPLTWHDYGMCDDGYEVVSGWVWSRTSRQLVCVAGDCPEVVRQMLQDAVQKPVVNRVPVMGDADHVLTVAAAKQREGDNNGK